ncbi:class I SAM-dependent methyltransferase [Stieleria mannarensis]|uniref:class I SAM-dependent methyltransferase n=1 Tax=Stieleria mannarensis TaxID=2755585 RepID=UPI0016036A7B|nr:class I SAM-dependent methyltransferase [Rhodopirellula sp. JC639]
MNDDSSTPHVSNRHFYDRISHAYDAISDSNEHEAREIGERLLNVSAGERVLEIGYGTGNSIVHFAIAAGATGKVVGLDVSEGMRRVAQAKIDEAGVADSVELCVGDAVALPWQDNSFDAAFFSFTLELFSEEDIVTVLHEVHRILRSSGRIVVVGMATVRDDEQVSFLEKTYQWMHRHFPHIVDCRPIDAVALLQTNGFEVISEQRSEIWTMPVAAVLASKKRGHQ